ncbi:lysine--tRNA ligase [Candidatus Woesebacteria bacterium]|jgi:lysyl-tRNA synthetase class 2|nr:lysine--tRNA ligase [Candidatus Woesebacteria bacterium]MBP9687046.1 lysine--tRNA ligase [Candidatus Woesebacteria bacterium]
MSLTEIRNIRIAKAQKLREMGIDPYPSKSNKEYSNNEIISKFTDFDQKKVTLAGRLMSWREHGKLIFGHLSDESGKIQIFIQEAILETTNVEKGTLGFTDLSLVDIGDFVEVYGQITRTSRGEISIVPETLRILTKAIRPLPEKWEGITDQETIYRKRYLDLIMNPARRDLFKRKSAFWEANRSFLTSKGFLEVEAPVMEHVTGGADARPFVTHHNALDEDFYLRISTELPQKRLIGGGFEKVYTLAPNFRNEGIDDEHLQEYYQVEWYWAYADYKDNMELVRDMFRYIANKVYGKTQFTKGDHTFDLADEWKEIDYAESIKSHLGIDIETSTDEEMMKVLLTHKVHLDGAVNRNRLVDNCWKLVRKTIAGPAFLINEPKFMSPLAKSKPETPELTERFHVILAGTELGNGYSELNDPIDQYERFLAQQKAREAGDDEAQMMDIDFVEMLEYGMPPVSGYGHSERVFWFLENVGAREATLFPQMKKLVDPSIEEIYPEFHKLLKK